MAQGVPGGVFDLYREHVVNNPATFTAPVSDDFYQNAVNGNRPVDTDLGLSPAYGSTQAIVDSWQAQLRQLELQTPNDL